MTQELREEARLKEREREKLARKREELRRDFRTLAASPEGKRVFTLLLEQGNLFHDDYQPGTAGAYRAGQKAQAQWLWHRLRENLPLREFVAIAIASSENSGHAAGLPARETSPEAMPGDTEFKHI